MSTIQTVFSPTTGMISFSELADQRFFEFQGKLHYKIDDENFIIIDDDMIVHGSPSDYDNNVDYDTNVIVAPAGTGFTLMQS